MKKNNSLSKSWVVIDLETGGLNPQKHPIVEVAAVVVRYGEKKKELYIDEENSFDSIVKPYSSELVYEAGALNVSGITMEEVKKFGNKPSEVLGVMDAICEELNPNNDEYTKPVLVGYNIDDFDLLFMEKFYFLHSSVLTYRFSRGTIDLLKWAELFFVGNSKVQNLKLGTVCKYFGVKLENAHRAGADAFATAELFLKMVKAFQVKRSMLLET